MNNLNTTAARGTSCAQQINYETVSNSNFSLSCHTIVSEQEHNKDTQFLSRYFGTVYSYQREQHLSHYLSFIKYLAKESWSIMTSTQVSLILPNVRGSFTVFQSAVLKAQNLESGSPEFKVFVYHYSSVNLVNYSKPQYRSLQNGNNANT